MFNHASTVSNCLVSGLLCGQTLRAVISGLARYYFYRCGAVFRMAANRYAAIEAFSQWAAYQNPVVAFGIYGFIERCTVPFGLHHIWNVPFQMQIGEYTNAAGQVFTATFRALYMAGDPTAGMLSAASCSNVRSAGCGPLLSGSAKPENRAKWAVSHDFRRADLVLTGITEPIEFSFMFVAPITSALFTRFWRVWHSRSVSCWGCVTVRRSPTV